MSQAIEHRYLTPPQVAELLGVSHPKVLHWIDTAQLAAIDVCSDRGGRPQWKIGQAALDAFLESRTATPPPPKAKRRKRGDDLLVRKYT